MSGQFYSLAMLICLFLAQFSLFDFLLFHLSVPAGSGKIASKKSELWKISLEHKATKDIEGKTHFYEV